MDDRDTLIRLWDDAWGTTHGWTPFSRLLEGLTPEQAAWTPARGRHSIWQIVNHLCFWNEYVPARAAGADPLPSDEIQRQNWLAPAEPTEHAWRQTVERYARTRSLIRDALADHSRPLDSLREMLTHHAYHAGQIMHLRALQNLPPIV